MKTLTFDGTNVSNPTSETGVSALTTAAMLPLKGVIGSESNYVDEVTAGRAAIAAGGISFFVGEAFGHRRARKGKKSFVPLFRG